MNLSEDQLESVLRRAPWLQPPPGLRAQLVRDIDLSTGARRAQVRLDGRRPWFRLWWPTLTASGLALAGLFWVSRQQADLDALREAVAQVESAEPTAPAATPLPAPHQPSTVPMPDGSAELDRLRATVSQLSAAVSALEALRSENAQLRTQVAAEAGVSEQEFQELLKAREQALSIQCVNNLKQLGLSARLWATDNGDVLPPNILAMTNEMAAPKVLLCPADTARSAASNWADFGNAHVSYEHLAASASETEPQRVLFRCPIHGHIALVDGSVQSRVALDHPEQLTERDGKLYHTPANEDAPEPAAPAPANDAPTGPRP